MADKVIVSGFGVNVIGFVSARLGLGVAARATVAALVRAGVPVAIADVQLGDGRSLADNSWSHLNITKPELAHPVTIVHMNPPEAQAIWRQYPQWFTGRFNCCVPFFELASVPDHWLEHLALYDAILAPTDHIAAAIRNALAIPVRRFPIAADIGKIVPASRDAFGIPNDRFAFVATWDTDSGLNRKNGIGVLRAFAAMSAGRNDVVLVVKTNGIAKHPDLEREVAAIPPEKLVVVDAYLDYASLLGLYGTCDAFVSLHRAEGLGLGLLEAMLLGKPVVATGWSGNMDFMDDSCASLVRYAFTPVQDTQAAYHPQYFSQPQRWADPDLHDAAERMRRLVDDRNYCSALGRSAMARATAYRDAFFDGGAANVVRGLYGARNPS